MNWLKNGGLYEVTIDYFMDAIHLSMWTAILSGLMLLIDFKDPVKIALAAVAIWIFLGASAIFATLRVIRLFSKILKNNI